MSTLYFCSGLYSSIIHQLFFILTPEFYFLFWIDYSPVNIFKILPSTLTSFLIFHFHHVAGELCSSDKDAPLSLSALIHWVSYSLNLSSDAKKCPFGERKGNALVKIGKSTNSSPQAQTKNEWGVQFWSQKFAQRVDFTVIPLCFWTIIQIYSFVSFGIYLPKFREKVKSFTLFWKFKIFRRYSGKYPITPITQTRPLAFLNFFFHHFL